MRARKLIEAETPRKAMKAAFGTGPRYVTDADVETRWVRSGNPDYPDHWQAMWNNPFTIQHRNQIRGCPLGSSFQPGTTGKWLAVNDLVNRTNRESNTNFAIKISDWSEYR